MKIFGTIFPFVETSDDSFKLGRYVANYEFFKSLLLFGSFDEFHIFCLSIGHFNSTKKKLLEENIPEVQKKKIRLFLYNHLINQLRTTEYHVFHLGGWGYFFPGLVYLRNTHAKNIFPITGLIHSLNGIETKYHALKMCIAPLLPFDTIICSSIAGRKVIENIFNQLRCDFSVDAMSVAFKGATSIIPLSIGNEFFTLPSKQECRANLKISSDDIVLLSIGRFSPQTKADLYPLIKTIQRVRDELPGCHLTLVLAGSATPTELQLVKQSIEACRMESIVRCMVNFTDELKRRLYGAADIYLSISDNLQETFGISVIEAMAAGLPVIVSDIDGYREHVQQNRNGYIVPTLWTDQFDMAELAEIMNFGTMQLMLAQCMAVDTEILYRNIISLLTDTSLRTRMGNQARETALQKYRWQDTIGVYETLWDNLANQAKQYDGKIIKRNNPFLNDYLQLFEHYPTARLTENNLCTITAEGKQILLSGNLPLPYADIASLIDSSVIMSLLRLLSKQPMQIKEIQHLDTKLFSGENTTYTLLWMAKYSLIHIT